MKIIYLPILFIVPLFFTSCGDFFENVKEVELPEHQPKLAVFATISGQTAKLSFTSSKPVLDNEDFSAEKTAYTIIENDNIIKEGIYKDSNNIYTEEITLPTKIKAGKTYILKAKSQKLGEIQSVQTPLPPAVLSNGKYIKNGGLNYENNPSDRLEFNIQDNGEYKNYYIIMLDKIDKEGKVKKLDILSKGDPGTKKIKWDNRSCILLSDNTFNGKIRHTGVNTLFSFVNLDIKFRIRVLSITKETFNFLISLKQYEKSNFNPFAEPVVVTNNIENGYGLFSVYTFSDLIIKPE